MLRCRIAAEKDHIELNQKFNHYTWTDLPGAMESWARNFVYRVSDISSLGNVVSSQNRFVQLNYVKKENELRKGLAVAAARLSHGSRHAQGGGHHLARWTKSKRKSRNPSCAGFNVYRDGVKLNASLLPPRHDHLHG